MTALLQRNSSFLLSDLQQSLPLKLRSLRALFPEVNLTALIEKEATLLSRDASSFLVPRLNLFARVTGYAPRHVVHCLAVEHPTLLAMRWNRLKRIEIVRDERFWSWFNTQPEASAMQKIETTEAAPVSETASAEAAASSDAAALATSSSVSSALSSSNQPSSLPFSVFVDLVSLSSDDFASRFPWFSLSETYSPMERELIAAKAAPSVRETAPAKHMQNKGAAAAPTEVSSSSLAADLLSRVSSMDLATVPGHPQPLSLALGQTPDALLARDALRAKQRMDYLAVKADKREAAQQAKEHMRQQEREHQQKKMRQYTERFQAHRHKTLSAEEEQPLHRSPWPTDRPAAGEEVSRPSASAAAAERSKSSTGFDESSYPAPRSSRAAYMPMDEEEAEKPFSRTNTSRSSSDSGGFPRGGGAGRSSSGGSSSWRGGGSGYAGRERSDGGLNRKYSGGGDVGGSSASGGVGSSAWRPDRRTSGNGDRSGGGRAAFQNQHQKNRPGHDVSQRHRAHPEGKIESFGARPTPLTTDAAFKPRV